MIADCARKGKEKVNICVKCKAELPEAALFCPFCGKKQTADKRKRRKRVNGSGTIVKLSGKRGKPYNARKNGVSVGCYATYAEAQKALERITDVSVTEKYNLTLQQVYDRWHTEHSREISEKALKDYEWAFNLCAPLKGRKIRQKAIDSGASLLIDRYKGSHVYSNYAKREWKTLMEEIGQQGMTPYVCRHTFITNAIRGGMDLPVLEAIVGHVDRETTKIYTHLRADDLVEAVQSLEAKTLTVGNKLVTQSDGVNSKKPKKFAK